MKEEEFVGVRLKSERQRLHLTLPAAGDLCGVTGKTISTWEKGGPIPSDKLVALWESGFDVFYVLTGGRIASEASKLGVSATHRKKLKIQDNSSCYENLDAHKDTRTRRPSSEAELGRNKSPPEQPGGQMSPDDVAELGRLFFNAWTGIFHSHGTEMQSAIMTALKGSDVAHYMVSEQFHEKITTNEKPARKGRSSNEQARAKPTKSTLGGA